MSYTPKSNTYRVESIEWGATQIPDPTGGTVDVQKDHVKSMPGTRLSPARALDSYDVHCSAEGTMRFAPLSGAAATLTYTVLCVDESTLGTVACAHQIPSNWNFSMNEKPHKCRQDFVLDTGNTEDIDTVSIT